MTMTNEQARSLLDEYLNGDMSLPNPDLRAALNLAIAALGGGEVVEYRMWDSQWVNVVNHERAYADWDMEEAINHAVKLTEQAMAKNIRDGKWPPARVTHPLPPSPQGETHE
jgi:hypothetical protein